MSQEGVLRILNQRRNEWFSSLDLARLLNVNRITTARNIRVLIRTGMVDWRKSDFRGKTGLLHHYLQVKFKE